MRKPSKALQDMAKRIRSEERSLSGDAKKRLLDHAQVLRPQLERGVNYVDSHLSKMKQINKETFEQLKNVRPLQEIIVDAFVQAQQKLAQIKQESNDERDQQSSDCAPETKEEREKAVQKCLDEGITGRNEISKKTKIPHSSVSRTYAWKARKIRSDQAQFRAISDNKLLSKLVAQQAADAESSPLDDEGRNPRSHLYQPPNAKFEDD